MLRLLLVGLIVCTGCGLGDDDPADVASRFWEAVEAGDLEGARREVSRISADALDEWFADQSLGEATLGETLRNDNLAVVETSLRVGKGETPLHAAFPTHLVREEGVWRIDVDRTRRELARALFAAGALRVQEAINEGLNELGKALEQGARDLDDALHEAIEELQKDREYKR